MSLVEKSNMLDLKIKKAVALINFLRESNKELEDKLNLVLNHNEEIQELLDKSSANTAQIEEAILGALDSLDSIDFDSFEEFSAISSDELAQAELFDGNSLSLESLDDLEDL